MNKEIGKVTTKVIGLLNLNYENEIPIYIGDNNINHMVREHPEDFKIYGNQIQDIINKPTYVALNPKKYSIEYIKEYKIKNDFVLVAVRASSNGNMFARTLFKMTERKKDIYLKKRLCKKIYITCKMNKCMLL